MIPPSYLFPVDRLRNGPDPRPRRQQLMVSIWAAAIAGAVAGGVAAYAVTQLAA